MIANLLNTLVGLVLAYVVVLVPHGVEQQYGPLLGFGVVIFLLALWARRTDPQNWYSSTNMVLGVGLAVLSLLPLETLPTLAFWGGLWAACLVPTVSLWAALYRRDVQRGAVQSTQSERGQS